MLVGYARTSTVDQVAGLEAQERDLKAAGCERIFKEQRSSVDGRPELEEAMRFVRSGDKIVVTRLDRLGRNVRAVADIADELHARGIGLCILQFGDQALDTSGAGGRLTLNIFASFAQFEREIMLERQREGIAKAKAMDRDADRDPNAKRKYAGRKATARVKAPEIVQMRQAGASVAEIVRQTRVGRGSVYRALTAAGLHTPETREAAPQ